MEASNASPPNLQVPLKKTTGKKFTLQCKPFEYAFFRDTRNNSSTGKTTFGVRPIFRGKRLVLGLASLQCFLLANELQANQIIWMNFMCFLFQKNLEIPLHTSRVNFRGVFGILLVWRNYDVEFVESSIEGIYENKMVGYQSDDGSQIFTPGTWNNYIDTKRLVGNHQTSIHLKNCLACGFIPGVSPQNATSDSEPPQHPIGCVFS